MTYEDALREVLNRVYRNTDDCEMLSIKSAPAAADYWLRQGYSLEDTNELIKASTALSKTGLISSAEATQYLTSAIKGYKVEIDDAMSVADKLSAVDMAAAVSVSGLAEGMSKTANSARLAGVEMDGGKEK